MHSPIAYVVPVVPSASVTLNDDNKTLLTIRRTRYVSSESDF